MQNPFRSPSSPADLTAPMVQRQAFFAQDPVLLVGIQTLAELIQGQPAEDDRHPPHVTVVGGFVRDMLLDIRSKDADMEVFGMSAERLSDLLEAHFSGQVIRVGQSFGILKIRLKQGFDLDISIPRRDSKAGKGHTGFIVESDPFMAPKDAARRRDFTINALSADPFTGEVIDVCGGLQDLADRVLRVVDPGRFQDDPLRVYRALQFVARFQLSIDPETFRLMREMVARGDLSELSPERVTDEIKKLVLRSVAPSRGFELARELGIVERTLPELQALIGTDQEPEWHPEGDVWIHTMMVIDQAARLIREPSYTFSECEQLQVMLGALCHDLGKPATTEHLEGRIRSRGHESAGIEPTKRLFSRWRFSHEIETGALMAAQEHLKPGMLARELETRGLDEVKYANAVRKLLKRIYPVSWRVLLAVAEADYRGRSIPGVTREPYPYAQPFQRAIIDYHLDEDPVKPLVRGQELIDLGVEPGPRMGEWIQIIEEARDRGEIQTHEEAMVFVKKKLGIEYL